MRDAGAVNEPLPARCFSGRAVSAVPVISNYSRHHSD